MDYKIIERACEQLDYRAKLRLAQQLIQSAQSEEEDAHPQNRAGGDKVEVNKVIINNNKNNKEPESETLFGLNLKDALDVHNTWKTKLEKELSGNKMTPIDATQAAHDHLCGLGKWLYGPGKKLYSNLPEYVVTKKAHAKFHQSAADVINEFQSGNKSKAEALLKNEFRSASNMNRLMLVSLFSAARKKQPDRQAN